MKTVNNNIYKTDNLNNNKDFKILYLIKKYMDEYYLDAIFSLFPGVGDFVTQIFSLVYIYFSIVKLQSIRLTTLIIFYALVDICIGLIPILGVVLDFFNKSYKTNYELIIGYVNKDKAVMNKINKHFTFAIFAIIGLIVAIVFLIKYTLKFSIQFLNWFFS